VRAYGFILAYIYYDMVSGQDGPRLIVGGLGHINRGEPYS
jgi:hypothetical protein